MSGFALPLAHAIQASLSLCPAPERLEDRCMLSVTLNNITGPDSGSVFNIPSGKDLYVPLIGTDAGKTITYSASSSNANG